MSKKRAPIEIKKAKIVKKQISPKPVAEAETIAAEETAAAEKAPVQVKKKFGSKAKAMGFRSALALGRGVAVTSFISSDTNRSGIVELADAENGYGRVYSDDGLGFTSAIQPGEISIKSTRRAENGDGVLSTEIPNPFVGSGGKRIVRSDYIGSKPELERRFFGREFPDNNVYVQIAYNVFDISKILLLHINNIVYMFYNLNRNAGNVSWDMLGQLYSFKDYDAQKEYLSEERNKDKTGQRQAMELAEILLGHDSEIVSYFNGVFVGGKRDTDSAEFRHNYRVLRLLTYIRNLCMHALPFDRDRNDGGKLSEERLLGFNDKEFNGLLDKIYDLGVKNICGGFEASSRNNLYMLSRIYENEDTNDLTRDYFGFTVLKENANIGINLKKIREYIVSYHMPGLADKQYDTCRGKLYTVLGFVIGRLVSSDSAALDGMVGRLRLAMKDEEKKEAAYAAFAGKLFADNRSLFEKTVRVFDEEKAAKFKSAGKVQKSSTSALCEQMAHPDKFAELVYFVCKFLDGKEINDLTTSLINKIDGIGALIDAAEDLARRLPGGGDELAVFREKFPVFFKRGKKSGSLALGDSLRIVKTVSQWKNKDEADMLQIKASDSENEESAVESAKQKYSSDRMWEAFVVFGIARGGKMTVRDGISETTPEYAKFKNRYYPANKDGVNDRDRKFKNFIISSVLKNRRFDYVVKYNDPAECCGIMRCRPLVRFAVGNLPDKQVERYCRSIDLEYAYNDDNVKQRLADYLCDFDRGTFIDEFTIDGKSPARARQKNLITLYLTVLYLITKSMVRVNARFSMAFESLERDELLLVPEYSKHNKEDYAALTRKFLARDKEPREKLRCAPRSEKGMPREELEKIRTYRRGLKAQMHFDTHTYDYLSKDLASYDKISGNDIFSGYRNGVMHLNIVKDMVKYAKELREIDSYYGLYCYILQRRLAANNKGGLAEYASAISEHRSYSKDLMKILNIPFAYNLARYKNLCIKDLFEERDGKGGMR